ncbi:MAG: aminoglycoside phosphotransferase family protein [Candidatus Daviesbacteria bacterium]
MDKQSLKYSENLDKIIVKAIENDLKVFVILAEKLTTGEFNYSYKIKTDKGFLLARVFRERNSPENGKLEWLEEKLTEHNIPHAKTLSYTRDSTYFSYGYMVQEFIEGMIGSEAILEGHIGFEEFFNQYVAVLQKIHSISVDKLGKLPNWAKEIKTFYESGVVKYNKIRERLRPLEDIEVSVHESVLKEVQKLKNYDGLYKPVLLQGDPGADNAILKKDGEMVLIDWDNSVFGSWIEEYAGMTFRGTYLWRYKTDEERNEMVKRSFRNYYRGVDFDDPNLLEIVKIFHLLKAYKALAVHYFQHENVELYTKAKENLYQRLQNSS